MYPLSFSEFIKNSGLNESVIDYLKKQFKEKKKIDETIHSSLRTLYLRYLVVGGMPEVVNAFFETYDLNYIRSIQREKGKGK